MTFPTITMTMGKIGRQYGAVLSLVFILHVCINVHLLHASPIQESQPSATKNISTQNVKAEKILLNSDTTTAKAVHQEKAFARTTTPLPIPSSTTLATTTKFDNNKLCLYGFEYVNETLNKQFKRMLFLLFLALASANASINLQSCTLTTHSWRCFNIENIFPSIIGKAAPSLHETTPSLDCINCKIPNFTNLTFPYHVQLTRLNLTSNAIEKVLPRSFSSLQSVEVIILSRNKISEVHENAFNGRYINELYLNDNVIEKLRKGFLNGTHLSSLDISGNSIENLTSNVFSGSSGLLGLSLANNLIESITFDSFTGLNELRILSLEKNRLTTIENGIFSKLTDLRELNLASNLLSKLHLGSFSGLDDLEFLNISNNKFTTTIPTENFLSLSNLIRLDISKNKLYDVGLIRFPEDLPKLEYIYIDDLPLFCDELVKTVRFINSKTKLKLRNLSKSYNSTNIKGINCIDTSIYEEHD